MIEMKKLIYVTPCSDKYYAEATDKQRLKIAAKDDEAVIYDEDEFDDFIYAFNHGEISDEGYLYLIK